MELNTLKDRFQHFQNKQLRPGQISAVNFALESNKKIVVICAPTGSGKSLLGMMLGANQSKFAYLCSSKALQRQLQTEFPEALLMMGRNNFPCALFPSPNLTAADCIGKKECWEREKCEYEIHKKKVLAHPYQIINYHYMLFESNYVGKFSDYPIIIADEGDMVESILSSFVNLSFSPRIINKLNIQYPERKTSTAKDGVEIWKKWAGDVKGRIEYEIGELNQTVVISDPKSEKFMKANKELNTFKNLYSKLELFQTHVDDTWLFEVIENRYKNSESWEFKPLWLLPEFTHPYFFSHGSKFIFMSATFLPMNILAHILGIDTEDIDYLELDSSFPIENRPVLLNPAGDLKYKTFTAEVDGVLSEIERIMEAHPDHKGIIHTVSWKLNKLVMGLNQITDWRMITHGPKDKDERLKEFMETDTSLVFVSPSSMRGLDLPDDKCRFSIITKAPYLSMADKMVSQRVYGSSMGAYWYKAQAAQEIIQACGRAVRHEDDWAVSYVIEKQAVDLILNHQSLFPKYFMEAVDIV